MNVYAICIIHTVAVILFAGGLPSTTLLAHDDPPGFFFPLQLHVMDVGAVWVVCLLPNNNSIRLERKPITSRGSCFRTGLENHLRHPPTYVIYQRPAIFPRFVRRTPVRKMHCRILASLVMTHRIVCGGTLRPLS